MKLRILTSQGTRPLTAHRLEALIVPAGLPRLPAESAALLTRTPLANDQLQRRVRADLEPRRGGDSVQE